MSNDELLHSRATADQLLRATEINLASIHRQLSNEEQEMAAQIRLFVKQSHDATNDGDAVRARVLALKAHLLSDDLVKR